MTPFQAPRPSLRHQMRASDPGDWLRYAMVAILGGLVGAGLMAVFAHLTLSPSVHPWTLVGLIATLTGVLAAILGILSALAVAFQWLVLDRRVDQRVQEHRDALERDIRSSVRQYVQAVGELAMNWMRAADELEQVAERVLHLAPDMPDVAPLMAERYLGQLQQNWTSTTARSAYCEPGSLTAQGASLLDSAAGWADRAYATREYHDRGYGAWVKAQVAAWHKEPGTCIGYLEECQAAGISLHDAVNAHSENWRTITSCTHGACELDKLDRVLQLLGYQRPSTEAIRQHCLNLDVIQRASLWAVHRQTGNTRQMVVEGLRGRARKPRSWSIVGPRGLPEPGPADSTFEAVIGFIEATWIPIWLIPPARPMLAEDGRIIGVQPNRVDDA